MSISLTDLAQVAAVVTPPLMGALGYLVYDLRSQINRLEKRLEQLATQAHACQTVRLPRIENDLGYLQGRQNGEHDRPDRRL